MVSRLSSGICHADQTINGKEAEAEELRSRVEGLEIVITRNKKMP